MEKSNAIKIRLSDLLLDFERKKDFLLSSHREKQKELHEELESLRLEYGVPNDKGFSVSLPVDSSGRVAFSKTN